MSKTQTEGKVRPTSIVYWLRFFLAVVAGFANYLIFSGFHVSELPQDYKFIVGVGLGVLIYAISVVMVKYLLRYGEVQLKGKNKYITLGGGTFIVVWIMVAVLLNTILGG